ncbi:hypothetical protein ACU4GD_45370 [Cupriavidus basilensis]
MEKAVCIHCRQNIRKPDAGGRACRAPLALETRRGLCAYAPRHARARCTSRTGAAAPRPGCCAGRCIALRPLCQRAHGTLGGMTETAFSHFLPDAALPGLRCSRYCQTMRQRGAEPGGAGDALPAG